MTPDPRYLHLGLVGVALIGLGALIFANYHIERGPARSVQEIRPAAPVEGVRLPSSPPPVVLPTGMPTQEIVTVRSANLTASDDRPRGIGSNPLACAETQHGTGHSSSTLVEGKLIHGADSVADDVSGEGADATDSRLRTAWCEGREGDGLGEWVELKTCCSSSPDTSLGLGVAPGFQSKSSTWGKNNRVAEARLDVASGTELWNGTVTFADTMTDQYIEVPGVRCTGGTVTVRLTISRVFKGSRYSDTCVSDISVYARPSDKSSISTTQAPSPLDPVASGQAVQALLSDNRLSASDIETSDCDYLWAVRNWVYARHGYTFTTEKAKAYFSQQAAYHPNAAVNNETIGRYLSATDEANAQLIVDREKAIGCN